MGNTKGIFGFTPLVTGMLIVLALFKFLLWLGILGVIVWILGLSQYGSL